LALRASNLDQGGIEQSKPGRRLTWTARAKSPSNMFGGRMSDHQAMRIQTTDTTDKAQPAGKERSGVFAKSRGDAGGWGLVLVDLAAPPRPLPLTDGAVVGSAARDAKLEGKGVAPEHARVMVRSDGCYVEDLGSPGGTFVGGVRARRINVSHGDVVRMGDQLAVFVERDLVEYTGARGKAGALVHGPKQRKEWIDPVLSMAQSGASLCIEGPPGTGKRTLARLAAATRETAGEILTIDGRSEAKPAVPTGVRPHTWLVLDVDRLPRPAQLEIAHAVGRSSGVSVIATSTQPLDRAVADGRVAPWFASLFSGKRVTIPSLDARREDIPAIVRDIAEAKGIALERITPDFLEALLRAGWPGGVPQLETAITTAAEQAQGGPLTVQSIAESLARPTRVKPSLPPSADPALARARIEDALARANGSVASAARSLGMSRQAIYREADRLGLDIARRKLARS
jgi:hypothetical protein